MIFENVRARLRTGSFMHERRMKMQKHIFRNMDGMTYSDFLDVFVGLKHKENLLVRDFCLDSYRFVIGEKEGK